ncbi:pitrilysin family protein [uncultured Chryseobacterium sp.]|uniref:M16 family metallopeptidase n=2 Tax=uncultured Chryseobacterium sp. TaxID=259322 RepID=UPI0025D449CE|nr:pitrilysin family protein [uncultured Chryseobacterium sp.]
MIKKIVLITTILLVSESLNGQHINYEEYDLTNGLHVILHKDNSAPVVTTSVMYHVGSKDEIKGKTGFAHFFEHLMFEGTLNIKRGEWFKLVSSRGGDANADTTKDRTYYYTTLPSSNEQFGLWMEAERMRNPIINTIGVETQREVVKEEKRLSSDNEPYGNLYKAIMENVFTNHPYNFDLIGSMDDLNSAKLEEFRSFYKKFYVPNNATLVVAGDIDVEQTKKWIKIYFEGISKGIVYAKNFPKEIPITKEKEFTATDPNIKLPAYAFAYRAPGFKEKDSYILKMISLYLSEGKSSVLSKKLIEEKRKALEVNCYTDSFEDYSVFVIKIKPLDLISKNDVQIEIDEEIKKLQTTLISEQDLKKLHNIYENKFINSNLNTEGIAESLATYHQLHGNTNLINEEIDIYRSITRKDIQDAAKKYLNSNQRIIINYLPEKQN